MFEGGSAYMVLLYWFLKCGFITFKILILNSKLMIKVIFLIGAGAWPLSDSESLWVYHWMRVLMCLTDVGYLLASLLWFTFGHKILCSTWDYSL